MAPLRVVSWRRPQRRSPPRQSTPFPRSTIRVLADSSAVEAALERAIDYERPFVDAIAARITHYEEMHPRALVIVLPEAAEVRLRRGLSEADSA